MRVNPGPIHRPGTLGETGTCLTTGTASSAVASGIHLAVATGSADIAVSMRELDVAPYPPCG